MLEHVHDSPVSYLHSSAAWIVGGFSVCALLLGIIGLYALMAYSVSQRTSEIGVRMALGAPRAAISRLILREAGALVLFGLASGIAASMVTDRLLRSLLFAVDSWDLAVLATVCAILAFAALFAAWIPARLASGVNPTEALRNQ